ncbi:venom carboxylesterase-6-like [Hyposmocoma kahamanoa]|uniref:venom carboxylesterase-6-like n=1 Tax=Hyposmocoma kahamanoa TaxID=1477025 RepID=UPI000E6D9633|nr:venom carboxylesterase-6-like [Hyposmocoma kahamanoa]
MLYKQSMYYRLMLIIASCVQIQTVQVNVKQGTVFGTTEATVFERRLYYAFYGVPYARPPVRALRFKDPEPIKNWKRHLDATKQYRGTCAQPHIVHKHGIFGVEDCLYLNIYTPHLPKSENEVLKPVAVWIHGYAFTSTFSHIHGPDFFIEHDVIVVTLTHRINVFGFMNVKENNTNMGLKDIAVGLKWIKSNIGQFGGDKKKITVIGTGSGATFLSLLLMSKYRKLFTKMILQSGGAFSPSIFQGDAEFEKLRFEEELKKITIKDVMKATTKDIVAASQKVYKNIDVINFQKPLVPFSPIVETKSKTSIISKSPEIFFSNKNNLNLNISIMIGFNSQESISEIIPFLRNPFYLKSFSNYFKFMIPFRSDCSYNYTTSQYRKIGAQIKNKYFADGINEKSIEKFMKYSSDLHKYPVYKFIRSYLSNLRNKMFVYKFNYVGKFNAMKATSVAGATFAVKGAASGDEICYLFNCEPLWDNYVNISKTLYDQDRIFIKELTGLWTNFVKSGDPTPPSQTNNYIWLPMTQKDDNVLLISKTRTRITRSNLESKMLSFWNEIYKTYYKDCKEDLHEEL